MERHPVYRTAYNLLGQVIDICKGMDKHILETIGKKAINLSYDIVLSLKLLNDSIDKRQSIIEIKNKIQELKFIVTILRDKRSINIRAFFICDGMIDSLYTRVDVFL